MAKQPKLMDISRMRDIFEPHLAQIKEDVFINDEMAIIHGNPSVFKLIMQQTPPFVINDHRLGVITNGEGVVNLNLVDKHLRAGTILYLGPGTIITPCRISDDLAIMGVGLFTDFSMPFAVSQYPAAFNGQVRDFQLPVSQEAVVTACSIIDTLWQLVHQPDYHRPTVTALVAALMHHYDWQFSLNADRKAVSRSREQTIFDRFIQLVNDHCCEQHQLDYYADRMCITKRYLGAIVKQTTGVTPKEWIDRALIAHAKAMLLHSDKPVTLISEELNFPNPSFFTKYFKRLTGTTPLAFASGTK